MLPLALGVGLSFALRGGGYVLGDWAPTALVACLAAVPVLWFARGGTDAAHAPRPVVERAAVAAVVAYAAWSALGIAWAPDRFAAHEEAARTALHASMLLLAMVVARSRRQVVVAIAAWVACACIVACATLWRLTDLSHVVLAQGRLLGTLGYPNGWAALLLAPVPPALALACVRTRHPVLRGGLVGGATLLVLVATMSQSRGALAALLGALVLTVALAVDRARMVAVIGFVGAGVAAAWPRLSEVYRVRPRTPPAVRDAIIGDARVAVVAVSLAVLVIAAAVAMVDECVVVSRRVRRGLVVATWVLVAASFVVATSTLVRGDLLAGRLDNVRDSSTSARVDTWRGALRAGSEHPVLGVGPGNVDATIYRYRDRVYRRTPRQVHQLTLENVAERGAVGAALLLASIAAITACALRARAHAATAEARLLVAGLVGSCAGWLAHAQVDWVWHLAAVTVPVAIAAGCLLSAGRWATDGAHDAGSGSGARVGLGVLVATIVLLVPLVVADRLMTDARRSLDSGRIAAAADAAKAATTWAPHAPRAWQLRARAAAALGDETAATRHYETSRRRSPDHWRTHAAAAAYYTSAGQAALARDARADAARLDPLGYGARSSAGR